MRGFFRMDYPREGGAGGTVILTDGAIAGWDTGGCFFRGSYADRGMGIEGELAMDFPNGGVSVTGETIAKGRPVIRMPFKIANAARAEEMVVSAPQGDIAVRLTRVSAL